MSVLLITGGFAHKIHAIMIAEYNTKRTENKNRQIILKILRIRDGIATIFL